MESREAKSTDHGSASGETNEIVCRRCGANVADDGTVNFCPHCGRKLRNAKSRPLPKRGFLKRSKFEHGFRVEVIWVGEEPIIGPFCKHCGNPQHVHGPQGECLNYRIHPALPMGDLPRPRSSSS